MSLNVHKFHCKLILIKTTFENIRSVGKKMYKWVLRGNFFIETVGERASLSISMVTLVSGQ